MTYFTKPQSKLRPVTKWAAGRIVSDETLWRERLLRVLERIARAAEGGTDT